MARFFIPAAASRDEAEQVLKSIARFAQRNVPPADERIFRLAFEHHGLRYVAEVGQPIDAYFTQPGLVEWNLAREGKPTSPPNPTVIAIIGGNPLLVCLRDRGVLRGEPIYVGAHTVVEAEYFEED